MLHHLARGYEVVLDLEDRVIWFIELVVERHSVTRLPEHKGKRGFGTAAEIKTAASRGQTAFKRNEQPA